MKFNLKRKRGFTLIEVIVGVALFAIISMVLVSVMTFALKMNYTNKDTYDADSYSKAFYEAIKNEDCKPISPVAPVVVNNKIYYKTFENIEDVTKHAKNEFSNIAGNTINFYSPDGHDPTTETGLSSAVEFVKNHRGTSDSIGFIVKVNWNSSDNVYELETWTWNLDKGESTMINRKTLLAPKS